MASSFQGQECQKEGGIAGHEDGQGKSPPVSTRMTEEEDPGTGLLSSCEQALQNDLILETICGFLPLSDLKTCRLVNRQWNRASLKACVQKCRPILCFHENVWKMRNLIQLISSSGDAFPCKSFVMHCGIMNAPEQESSVVDLFRAIAPIAEALRFNVNDRKIVGGDPLPNLQLPRLKSLRVAEFCSRGTLASNVNLCKNLILHSPQLTTLEVNFEYAEFGNVLFGMLASVQGQQIRRLHLWGPLNDQHFDRITAIGLKLNCLWLGFDPESILTEDEEGNSLTNFLSSQSSTLEDLRLRATDSLEDKLRIRFPKMKTLTQLGFEVWSNSGIQLSPIVSYAEHFPVLQSLSIVGFPTRELDSLFDFRIGPVDTVTKFELPWWLDNPALIWEAARIFPKVRKLVVPGRERIVMAAYEAWQKVEELKIKMIWSEDSADQVLTAHPRNNPGLAPQQLDERSFQPVEFLQNLKVLRLEHRDNLALTDHGCRLVLLKLRSLRCLDLSEGSSDKISEEVLQEMRDKFRVIC